MEVNIKHTDCFDCGVYLLNEERPEYSPYKHKSKVYLTQEENKGLKDEIMHIIKNSNEVLKICSFIITDKEIFEAILSKAQNTNTAIFILTQLDQSKLTDLFSLIGFLTEEEIKESTSLTHLKYIKILCDNGVHVRASISVHAKFIVSDRVLGFITSANLTNGSLTINTESGVYLDVKSSTELDFLFDVIFQRGTSYRQFLGSEKEHKMLVVQSNITMQKEMLPLHSSSSLRYTYETLTNNLYDEIIYLIDNANQYVYISTFSIVGLESLPEFTKAIKNSADRGVKIYIFCRGMNYRYDHLKGSQILYFCGSQLYGDVYNHSKGIINESQGMIFTANIDGNHGLKNGFEVGYILDEEQRKEFLEIHKYLIETSYYNFQGKPKRIDFFKTYINYEIKKETNAPVFPQDIIILINPNLNLNSLSRLPLFYGKAKDIEFIIAGHLYYKTKYNSGTFQIIEEAKPRFDLERYCLKYVNLKIISN
jgi:phosphatidylserine/phosphatidylglycerophosphate/cardiolipin synthase-like enzyme